MLGHPPEKLVLDTSGTSLLPFSIEVSPMKKKAKAAKEEVVSSTLRLPRELWTRINHIAVDKRLSMAQAVIQAVAEYCDREGGK
jgi:hypothetical protein